MGNPIFKLIQSLPINGWTTALGGLGLLLVGAGSFAVSMFAPDALANACVNGSIDPQMSIGIMAAGLTALGIGNKLDKAAQ